MAVCLNVFIKQHCNRTGLWPGVFGGFYPLYEIQGRVKATTSQILSPLEENKKNVAKRDREADVPGVLRLVPCV